MRASNLYFKYKISLHSPQHTSVLSINFHSSSLRRQQYGPQVPPTSNPFHPHKLYILINFIMSTTTSRSSSVSTAQSHTRRYSKSGIGGAGNYHKTCLLLPSNPSPITPRTIGKFSTSIGGAGNARCLSARPRISVEQREAREEAQRKAAAKNWHVGIGGAGNRAGVSVERRGSGADRMWAGLLGLGIGRRESIVEDSEVEELALKD